MGDKLPRPDARCLSDGFNLSRKRVARFPSRIIFDAALVERFVERVHRGSQTLKLRLFFRRGVAPNGLDA